MSDCRKYVFVIFWAPGGLHAAVPKRAKWAPEINRNIVRFLKFGPWQPARDFLGKSENKKYANPCKNHRCLS